jgi:hypothetical protein
VTTAASHDIREDEANDQYSSNGTNQDHSNDYVRDDVSDAVRLRPEVTDDPAAQRHGHDDHDESAPSPPITQPAARLSPAGPPTDTGFPSGRKGVGWHAPQRASSPGAASMNGKSLTRQGNQNRDLWPTRPA